MHRSDNVNEMPGWMRDGIEAERIRRARRQSRNVLFILAIVAGMTVGIATCARAQVVNHDHPSQYSGKGEPAPAVRPQPRPCIEGPAWWRQDVVPCAEAPERGTERPTPEKPEPQECDRCKDVVRDYWQDRDRPKSSKPGGPVGGDGKGRERARERRERVEECL